MYVCVCKAVTEREVERAVAAGARSVRDLRESLGVCSGCCKCASHVRSLLAERRGCQPQAEAPPWFLSPQPAL